MIRMFAPSSRRTLSLPRWKPSPSADRMTIEITPHTIPNMVRRLLILLAFRFCQTCEKMIIYSLKDDFLTFLQSFDDFRAGSITESDLDLVSSSAFGRTAIRRLDPGRALSVVDHSFLRNQQRVFMLVEHNFGVRRHVGSQLTGSVVDRN